MTLFVANLRYFTTEGDLNDWFLDAGYFPRRVQIAKERETGNSRGFGFVDFDDAEMAQAAIDELNGQQLQGRKILVRVSEQRAKKAK